MVLSTMISGTEVAMVVAIVILLVLTAALAMAETGLTRMTTARAASLVEEERRGASTLAALVTRPERFLNPVLLVLLVCQLSEAVLVAVLAGRLFGPWGVVVATLVNVGVVFVLAEAAPKTWAVQHPESAALSAARPVSGLVSFWPLRQLARGLIGLTNTILPGKGLKEGPFVSEGEILALADVAVQEEVIEAGERRLIEQIIEFGDTVVREVMVPRPDMVAVAIDFRIVDVMEIVLLNGLSRIPVWRTDIDDVVGIAYAKDLMRADRDGQAERQVGSLVRPAHHVPETKRVAELLPEMQAEHFHMAIVVDEYGGTAGLVTLEDLIEELVGEIVDEFDREEPLLEPFPDGAFRVDARMAVDEVNELLHASLPEGDWDSVGGLMFHLLGHIPVEGESVECDGRLLRAERVQGRRIGRVRILPASQATDPPSDETGEQQ